MITIDKPIDKITAIVVLYNPIIDNLISNLKQIIDQVDNIVIVDNSISAIDSNYFIENGILNYTYIFNNENLGIAKAQNIGIKIAKQNKSNFVFFMDQDSFPDNNLIQILYTDYLELYNNNIKISVIGSLAINKDNNLPYLPRLRKLKLFSFKDNIYKANEVISSGSLIDIKLFDIVGYFDELLFIDGVDHEWCWRSKQHGYQCAISKNARLLHSLGEGDKKILGFRIAISSPFRIYYQYRNYFYLIKKKYVPFYWKLNNCIKYSIKLFYLPLFVSNKYFIRIQKGVLDGIKL